MRKVVWSLQCSALPAARKYCKKCGAKTLFFCSEQFRVNAQRKYLDVWLIYRCSSCDTTWNATILTRVAPQSLPPALLEGFHSNDRRFVTQFAMDVEFLRKNGAEVSLPGWSVVGEAFSPWEAAEVRIQSEFSLPIRVSTVVRSKLGLSAQRFSDLLAAGKIKSVPEQDLRKCRVKNGIILIFSSYFPQGDGEMGAVAPSAACAL